MIDEKKECICFAVNTKCNNNCPSCCIPSYSGDMIMDNCKGFGCKCLVKSGKAKYVHS